MKRIIAIALLAMASFTVSASQTWIVIGDSILSSVSQGTAKQLATHLVSAEKDIVFKSLASPGSSIGHTDHTGFNSVRTDYAIDLIRGAWNAYNGVLIQAGTNDFSRNVPTAQTIEGLRRILAKVRADGKKALVLPMTWRADQDVPNAVGATLVTYKYVMALVCVNEFGDVCWYGGWDKSPLTTNAGAATDYDVNETAQGKQLHLNASGHRKLADWIKLEAAAAGYF